MSPVRVRIEVRDQIKVRVKVRGQIKVRIWFQIAN
jgi:hypothetical protein